MTRLERFFWTLTVVGLCGFGFFTVSAMVYRFLDTPYLVLYASVCAAATAMLGATAFTITNNQH